MLIEFHELQCLTRRGRQIKLRHLRSTKLLAVRQSGLPLASRAEDGRKALSTRGGIQCILFRLCA